MLGVPSPGQVVVRKCQMQVFHHPSAGGAVGVENMKINKINRKALVVQKIMRYRIGGVCRVMIILEIGV